MRCVHPTFSGAVALIAPCHLQSKVEDGVSRTVEDLSLNCSLILIVRSIPRALETQDHLRTRVMASSGRLEALVIRETATKRQRQKATVLRVVGHPASTTLSTVALPHTLCWPMRSPWAYMVVPVTIYPA